MNRLLLLILIFVVLSLSACDAAQLAESDESPVTSFFVLNAPSGSLNGSDLTLHDVPTVVYFTDRPNRVAGHFPVADFVRIWGAGDFDEDPPNADLAVLAGIDGESRNGTYELLDARLENGTVHFTIAPLQGSENNISGDFSTATLFVDENCCFTACSC